MISTSALSITWLRPDIEEERWEYFNHPAKQQWYRIHDISWDQIVSGFDRGELVSYPRAASIGDIPVVLSYHRYDDYQTFLARAKRGYRKNYSRMEDALQSDGSLMLKAPIILSCGGQGLLFSGYRRLCLGWNYGMIPYVWLVPLEMS
jgi:hypothetical protein